MTRNSNPSMYRRHVAEIGSWRKIIHYQTRKDSTEMDVVPEEAAPGGGLHYWAILTLVPAFGKGSYMTGQNHRPRFKRRRAGLDIV